MTTTPVSQETREAEVTQDDIGWATSAAQHLCSPQDSDAAIRLLAQAFARHRQQAERETLARMEPVAERYRHKKRGTVYEVVGTAELQVAEFINMPDEGDHLAIYRGEDGKLWARPYNEFHDGRFEPLPPAPEAGQ